MDINYEKTLEFVNTASKPSSLRITDIRFTDIVGAPMRCTLMKIYTNQGLTGLGEVRDGASRTYAAMLKSRLLGENPCCIDKLFRRIKQFGGHARQAGGVCGVEIALWDLAGKAYGVPVYQMLGGKFRDKIRIYCDTDVRGRHSGTDMGNALRARMDKGFTFLKMDLGIGILSGTEGTVSAPAGYMRELASGGRFEGYDNKNPEHRRFAHNRNYDLYNTAHPFTAIHITEKGFDILEEYLRQVRDVIGYEIPLAVDHFGHICVEDAIKLCRRIEKYNIAWAEDLIPWQYTDQYVRLRGSTTVPICTGEDIYLKENFRPLLQNGGVAVIHPDLLSSGGILENKKIGDMAQDYGVAMAIHMAESPVTAYAAVHSAAATENFLVCENHSVDVEWWDSIITGAPKKIIDNGYINVPDKPGLGADDYNDEVLREHIDPAFPELWASTEMWDNERSHDRLWS
ncbi:MAG: mandelate racemase/muconate lactonizing enzyme family protein [Eubacteriales bacterium]|jgi:gluconate/galactonate dehydratase|nr:mandelate racemase/muconate lactonizing enzyme family protein [Eubacteriales bacterium]